MNQITFEKLKEKCVIEFCSKNTRGYHGDIGGDAKTAIAQIIELRRTGKPVAWRKLMANIEDDCVKAIESVDVRNLVPLAQLCPESVPEWIKKGNYNIELSDKGWEFFRK